MRKIYFIRHAKSIKDGVTPDFERGLAERGKISAKTMGERLLKRGAKPKAFFTSPARRALRTAEIIAREIGFNKDKITLCDELYEASAEDLVAFLRGLSDKKSCIFVVCHNPAITEVCELLSDSAIDNIPTCGVFCIDFDAQSWREIAPHTGRAEFFDYPKKKD